MEQFLRSRPAYLLHVLRFGSFWLVGATAVVTVARGGYLPSIDGSGHRFWLFLVDFEGVHFRPACFDRFARPLISAPIISRLRYSQQGPQAFRSGG